MSEVKMTTINTAEKIETILNCYLSGSRTTQGAFGSLTFVPAYSNEVCSFPACYRVEADGKTFIVRSTAIGWSVRFGPLVGEDADLYVAAKMVTDTAPGGKASNLADLVKINS